MSGSLFDIQKFFDSIHQTGQYLVFRTQYSIDLILALRALTPGGIKCRYDDAMYKPGLPSRKCTLVKTCIDEEEYKNEDRHRRLGLSDTPGSFYPLSCEDEEEELKGEEVEEEEEKFTSVLKLPQAPVKPHRKSRIRVPFKPPRKPHPRQNFPELPIFCGIEAFEIIKAPPSPGAVERNPSSVSKSNSDISSQYEWIAADFIPGQETLFSNTQIVSTESDSTMYGRRRYAGGKDDDAPDDRDETILHDDIEEDKDDERTISNGMQIISSPNASTSSPENQIQSSDVEEETKMQETEDSKVSREEASNEHQNGQESKGQNATWSDFELTHASVMGPTLDDLLYWLAPMLGITGRRASNNGSESGEPVANDPPPEMFEMLHGMLGPPPDESILSGLQSFFRMLGLVSSEKAVEDEAGELSESALAEKEKQAKEQEQIETQTYEVRRVSNTWTNKKTEDPRDPYLRELIRPAEPSDQEGMSSSEHSSTIHGSRRCSSTSRCSRPDCFLNASRASSQYTRTRASDSRCVCPQHPSISQTGTVTERQQISCHGMPASTSTRQISTDTSSHRQQISCHGMPASISTRQISTDTSSHRQKISCHRIPKTISTHATQSHAVASTSQQQTSKHQMPPKKKSAHKSNYSHKAGSKSARQIHKGKSSEKAPRIAVQQQKTLPQVLKRRIERKEETTRYGLRKKPQRITPSSTEESDDGVYKLVTYNTVYEPNESVNHEIVFDEQTKTEDTLSTTYSKKRGRSMDTSGDEQSNYGNTYTIVKETIEDVEMPHEQPDMYGNTYTVVKETTQDMEMPTQEQNVYGKTYTVVTETEHDVEHPTTEQNVYSRNYTETTETTERNTYPSTSQKPIYYTESSTDKESIADIEDTDREVSYGEDTYQESSYRKDSFREDVDNQVPPREARYRESTTREDTYRKDVPYREPTYREDTSRSDTYRKEIQRKESEREDRYENAPSSYAHEKYDEHPKSIPSSRKEHRDYRYTHEQSGKVPHDREKPYKKETEGGPPVSLHEYKKYDKVPPSSRTERRDDRIPKPLKAYDTREQRPHEIISPIIDIKEQSPYKVTSPIDLYERPRAPTKEGKIQESDHLQKYEIARATAPESMFAEQVSKTDNTGKPISIDESRKEFSPVPLSSHRIVKEGKSRHSRGKSQPAPIKDKELPSKRRTKSIRKLPKTRSLISYNKKSPTKMESKSNQTDEIFVRKESSEKLIVSAPKPMRGEYAITKAHSLEEVEVTEKEIRKPDSTRRASKNIAVRKRTELRRQVSAISQTSDEEVYEPSKHDRFSLLDIKKYEDQKPQTRSVQTSSDDLGKFVESISSYQSPQKRFSSDHDKFKYQQPHRRSIQTSSEDLSKEIVSKYSDIGSIPRDKIESPKQSLDITTLDISVIEPQDKLSYSCKGSGTSKITQRSPPDEAVMPSSVNTLLSAVPDASRSETCLLKSEEKTRSDKPLSKESSIKLSSIVSINRSISNASEKKGSLTSACTSAEIVHSRGLEKIRKSSSSTGKRKKETAKEKSPLSIVKSGEITPSTSQQLTCEDLTCPFKENLPEARAKKSSSVLDQMTYGERELSCHDETCPYLRSHISVTEENKSVSLLDKTKRDDGPERKLACNDLSCPFKQSDLSMIEKKKSDSLLDKPKRDQGRELPFDEPTCPCLRSTTPDADKKSSSLQSEKTQDKESVLDRMRMICNSGTCGKDSCPAKRKMVDKVGSFPSASKVTSDEAAMWARCPCGIQCPCLQSSACKTSDAFTQPAPVIGPCGEGSSKTEVIKPKKTPKPKKSKAADKASQCKCECTCEEEESDTIFPKMYTMWALTRVNIYEDESRTYEVMALQPKPSATIPKTSEVVFVVLPSGNTLSLPATNTDTVANVEQPRRWCERPNCRSLFGEVCKKRS